jgi:hypothetical protein
VRVLLSVPIHRIFTQYDLKYSYPYQIIVCLGFRPILDAMKSFAKDENPIDIEVYGNVIL